MCAKWDNVFPIAKRGKPLATTHALTSKLPAETAEPAGQSVKRAKPVRMAPVNWTAPAVKPLATTLVWTHRAMPNIVGPVATPVGLLLARCVPVVAVFSIAKTMRKTAQALVSTPTKAKNTVVPAEPLAKKTKCAPKALVRPIVFVERRPVLARVSIFKTMPVIVVLVEMPVPMGKCAPKEAAKCNASKVKPTAMAPASTPNPTNKTVAPVEPFAKAAKLATAEAARPHASPDEPTAPAPVWTCKPMSLTVVLAEPPARVTSRA